MPKKTRKKRVVGERCINCQSTMTYFRVKTDDFMCRGCGKPFHPRKENRG